MNSNPTGMPDRDTVERYVDRVAAEAGRLELGVPRLDSDQRDAAGGHHVDALVAAATGAGSAPRVGERVRTGDGAHDAAARVRRRRWWWSISPRPRR